MKALTTLIFLITLVIQITSYAQNAQPEIIEENLTSELSALTQTIDFYFEQMLQLKTDLSKENLKINDPKLKPLDAERVRVLAETRANIESALKNYRSEIKALENDPESLELFEKSKLQYNVALIKAFLPRYESLKTNYLTRLLATDNAQYVEEILPRADALKLMFTQFDSNEPSKDAMNLNYRLSEMIKTHNAIADQVNTRQDAKIYQIYPSNLKIGTAAEEAALYESLAKGAEYKSPTGGPALLTTLKLGTDHFSIIATCAGLFGI